jgi:hypothetical protein
MYSKKQLIPPITVFVFPGVHMEEVVDYAVFDGRIKIYDSIV